MDHSVDLTVLYFTLFLIVWFVALLRFQGVTMSKLKQWMKIGGMLLVAVTLGAVGVFEAQCMMSRVPPSPALTSNTVVTATPVCTTAGEVRGPSEERLASVLFSRGRQGRDDYLERWYRVYREIGPPPTANAEPVVNIVTGLVTWKVD